MREHAQTARAMQRSIKENLTRVEQAIETCRTQVHVAAALEGELTRLATLGEIEVSVLTLARCAAWCPVWVPEPSSPAISNRLMMLWIPST